jgi:predicted nuclease of predicted toxin-antitoxin system
VLDEGVADSVGRVLEENGHRVIYANKEIPGSSDLVVCAFAELNRSILVAIDGDMKQIAKNHGVGSGRFKRLSLLKISCREWVAAERVSQLMTLIEHEWKHSPTPDGRRLFVEIKDTVVSSFR